MCSAWRNRSCSSSVHLSRGLVIVYGFRSFLFFPAADDRAAAGILAPLTIVAIVFFSLSLFQEPSLFSSGSGSEECVDSRGLGLQ